MCVNVLILNVIDPVWLGYPLTIYGADRPLAAKIDPITGYRGVLIDAGLSKYIYSYLFIFENRKWRITHAYILMGTGKAMKYVMRFVRFTESFQNCPATNFISRV